jgi:hypothetical protein
VGLKATLVLLLSKAKQKARVCFPSNRLSKTYACKFEGKVDVSVVFCFQPGGSVISGFTGAGGLGVGVGVGAGPELPDF